MSKDKYPILTEMGVEDINDIETYTTRIEGDVDVLKIYYHRHHGEWMAKSKKFKFKRNYKNIETKDGFVPYRSATESTDFYNAAIAELNKVVAVEQKSKNKKERLLEELEHLDKVVSRKIEDLRAQINEL